MYDVAFILVRVLAMSEFIKASRASHSVVIFGHPNIDSHRCTFEISTMSTIFQAQRITFSRMSP